MLLLVSSSYAAVSLLALVLYHVKNKLFLANNFLIGLIASVVLLIGIAKISVQVYSGYFLESMAFQNRMYGNLFYARMIALILAFILPLFNFSERFRKKLWLQYIVLAAHLLIIVFSIAQANSVNPGWDTVILPKLIWIDHVFAVGLGLIGSLTIVKFKLLPEFRN